MDVDDMPEKTLNEFRMTRRSSSALSISQPRLASEKKGEWDEYIDAKSKQRYYVHRERGTSTWIKPDKHVRTTTVVKDFVKRDHAISVTM